jgi:hypothetical protein
VVVMFPERIPMKENEIFTIFRGYNAILSILLTVKIRKGIWKYVLNTDEKLIVEIRNRHNEVQITKEYSKADVNPQSKRINVEFSAAETEKLKTEKHYITAYLNGYVVLNPQEIKIKDVVKNEIL